MTLRLGLLVPFLLLACSVKSETTGSASESSSDALSSGTDATTDVGSSLGHSQTSTPVTTDPSAGSHTTAAVTSANPSEPATTTFPETTSGGTDFTTGLPPTASDTATDGPACSDSPDQPNNATCTDESGCGCASGTCFIVPVIGGFCSECLVDADCPGGCTQPDVLHGVGAHCNAGGPGDGCGSDAACNDPSAPHCAVVLSAPPVFEIATCGACETDADCSPDAPNCAPDYDLAHFSGQFKCVPDGAVPNNHGCASDAACASGFCGEADVMSLLKMGICGECRVDTDCAPGQQCSEPIVELEQENMFGSVCN